MNSLIITFISVFYLLVLFYLAFLAEKSKSLNKSLTNNPLVFSLSLAIYCSAWTFYGNVSEISTSGIKFLTIYLGPTLMMILGWTVLRKIVRIAHVHGITSIADFVSARFGKNRTLGIAVTILSLLAGIPYIGLQIKAIASSFNTLTGLEATNTFYRDPSFFIAVLLVIFTILFGTRKILPNERHEGMIFAVAAESIYKLLAILLVGFLVVFVWHKGFGDIFNTYYKQSDIRSVFQLEQNLGYGTWFIYIIISGFAFIMLPRQFQVAVVENQNENNIRQAVWILPLYLFLITLFVIPLGLAGNGLVSTKDNQVIALPLYFSANAAAMLVYLGGFSAATGMIIVESIAISTMVTNSLILPLLLESKRFKEKFKFRILNLAVWLRRLIIVFTILAAYLYYKIVPTELSLVSLGLLAFVAVAQFGPAVFGGIYIKSLNSKGILCGIIAGALVWFFALVLPSLRPDIFPQFYSFFSAFRIPSFDVIANAAFWSLFLNLIAVVIISSFTEPSAVESKQALLFVNIFSYSDQSGRSVFWKGTAKNENLMALLSSFLGRKRALQLLSSFGKRNTINLNDEKANPLLVTYVENTISQYVGTSTASMLVSSVTNEEVVTVEEVLEVLKRSQQVVEQNAELKFKTLQLEKLSEELRITNQKLERLDAQKDDFIRTVTHEFRTPLTAIKALAEIVNDHDDLEASEKNNFLNTIIEETDRLSRMVNEILDIEKYESGKHKLNSSEINISELTRFLKATMEEITKEKEINLSFSTSNGKINGDRDKIIQMLINLISNSIKFVNRKGNIEVTIEAAVETVTFEIKDDGIGIPEDKISKVFEKFYQADNYKSQDIKGSGLGLPIVKNIVELHSGEIKINSKEKKGTTVCITFPTIIQEHDESTDSR